MFVDDGYGIGCEILCNICPISDFIIGYSAFLQFGPIMMNVPINIFH